MMSRYFYPGDEAEPIIQIKSVSTDTSSLVEAALIWFGVEFGVYKALSRSLHAGCALPLKIIDQHSHQMQRLEAGGAENHIVSIVIDDSEDDRLARSSSRPRRAHINRPDYSYRAFMDVMDDATTQPSHRHKRRRGLVTGDMENITSTLVSTLYLFLHLPLTIYRTSHMKIFEISVVH
jgi:hypothetical protein